MEIAEIKSRLTLSALIRRYGLKADKQNRLRCPFHEDKTPSLQLYYKTHTCYCFSSDCKTHGKSIDVIDFIMYYENLNKHDAIKKAESMLNPSDTPIPVLPKQTLQKENNPQKHLFLERMFTYFKNAVHNSPPARAYLESRRLDFKKVEIGYNAGQFHHGARKEESLINQCLEYGLLIDKNILGRTGEKAYGVFGKNCICFALRNSEYEIVSLYFRSIINDTTSRHYYLKNRSGLYPYYPPKDTRKLILLESIIDCASLLQIEFIKKEYSLLASYGTNGLTSEHLLAIKELEKLEEIVFCFDTDEAGRKAVLKYGEMLRTEYPQIKLTSIELPMKDINETLQGHDESIFLELLEKRRDIFLSTEKKPPSEKENKTVVKSESENKALNLSNAVDFLRSRDLLKNINRLIGTAGIVGEETTRQLLFLITLSYLNKQPLHALVQGSSGSGKTHLINRIADMMPSEDVLRFTRITESSLYNWGEFELHGKVIVIEDLDGLKEDALYALREFISNQVLRSSVTIKDKKGNNKSSHKIVKGQFSSLSATTKGETYEDNMSRSFLLAVDESNLQTQKIIDYQNKRNAGEIDPEDARKAVLFMQQIVRSLKHYEVINPYATKLQLPEKVHKIRRLNEMYQSVIKQVTFLNQYKRKLTDKNQLVTQIEDIEQATEVLFESIVLKVDELDGSLRQFFERLKKYVKTDGEEFILRDVRQELGIGKTQLFRYMQTLVELEYVKTVGGYANKGLKYKIAYRDNYQKLRIEIKDYLLNQISELKRPGTTA
jgi:DNA primase catalytic core